MTAPREPRYQWGQRVKAVKPTLAQPNEMDRKRIERALGGRKRYRYVSPEVQAVKEGYLVRSPCCSRNVDPQGGVIDIALLRFRGGAKPWRLYRREDGLRRWKLLGAYAGLADLLEPLASDPERVFWR